MAKESKKLDFQKEWPKIKKQLMIFGKDALTLAKKGEKELTRLSKEGRLRLDSGALSLQKEKLFYLIGKEFVATSSGNKSDISPKLSKLLKEMKETEDKICILNRKIKSQKKSK